MAEAIDASIAPPPGRRLFHALAGSVIPLTGIFIPLPAYQPEFVGILAVLAVSSLALDLARFRVSWLNRLFLRWLRPLLKSSEDRRVTGATYLLVAAFLSFLLFDQPVAVAVLLFLSLGDPAAALVGRPMPGPRLFGKSPVGTLAFVMVALLVLAALVGAGVTSWHWGYLAGAVAAGLAELLPLPGDDNLWVPLIAGAFIQYLPLLLTLVY